MNANVVGFDIGGANIKAADTLGRCQDRRFPMWQQPEQLAPTLREMLDAFDAPERVVITMTGEMADCFADRSAGVQHIVTHCESVFGADCEFYAVDGRFLPPADARDAVYRVAASNWHAMAAILARWIPGPGLLIDIGSTTTDLIPFDAGAVSTPSQTDHDRLRRGELIYAGVERTPICAIVDTLPLDGTLVPVMNEVFAVTDDCALLTGIAAEDEDDCGTCDGRPRTRSFAAARMARLVGLDRDQLPLEKATELALYVWERLQAQWLVAARALSAPDATWVLAGHGQTLLPVPEDRRCLDLRAAFDPHVSRVGPAYAIAHLAAGTSEPPFADQPLSIP